MTASRELAGIGNAKTARNLIRVNFLTRDGAARVFALVWVGQCPLPDFSVLSYFDSQNLRYSLYLVSHLPARSRRSILISTTSTKMRQSRNTPIATKTMRIMS